MKTMMSAALCAGALSLAAAGCDGGGAGALDVLLDEVEVATTQQALTSLYCSPRDLVEACYGYYSDPSCRPVPGEACDGTNSYCIVYVVGPNEVHYVQCQGGM